jgi:polar amino acid transport system substrate-binding protein
LIKTLDENLITCFKRDLIKGLKCQLGLSVLLAFTSAHTLAETSIETQRGLESTQQQSQPSPLKSPQRFQASTLHYPPYEYKEDGTAKGIAIELIKLAAKKSGTQAIEFNFYPWRRAVNTVQHGDSDMLFNAGKNEARQEWGHYVESVLIMQNYVLFKRKDAAIQISANFDNADKLPIAVRTGFLYGTGLFRDALDKGQFSYIVQSETTMQSIDLLLNKRVEVFVGDYLPVMHYIHQHGLENQIDIVKEQDSYRNMSVLLWPTYMVFSKKRVDLAYVNKITQALEEMKADGSYYEVFKQYRESLGLKEPSLDLNDGVH